MKFILFSLVIASAARCFAQQPSTGHVISDDCGFTDDNPESMVNEQPAPNGCTGMNFDSGQKARYLGKASREKKKAMLPQPVIDVVEPDCMQPRIT